MIKFKDLGLKDEILNALADLGFENPTPIQEKTIPHLLNNKGDLVALAQTGTGKTAAFSLPILHQMDLRPNLVQTLILCPTRELCLQIHKDILNFAKYLKYVKPVAVYGGASIDKQIKDIRSGGNIIVGTPGRTLDLLKRNVLKISDIQWLVLDEADEMLSMGFKEELNSILETTPYDKQVLLFSATMPKDIRAIANTYMKNPMEVSAGKPNTGNESIEHIFYLVSAKDKYTALKRIADINPDIYAIIFCRTKADTQEIADKLGQDGYNADALHGDLSQVQRDYVMNKFRKRQLQLLVATDVAARGLDVSNLTHVINYTIPDDPETYIHRSGRTGRAGNKGQSICIIHSRETGKIKDIERKVGRSFERALVPTGPEICEKQLFYLIDVMMKVEVNESQISPYLTEIFSRLEHMSKEEVIKRFVSVEFNRFLEYYKYAIDINVHNYKEKGRRDAGLSRESSRGSRDINYVRFKMNVGKSRGFSPRDLLGIVNEHLNDKTVAIGRIEIAKEFSFFDVDANYKDKVINTFKHTPYKGLKVSLVESTNRPGKKSPDRFEKKFERKKSYLGVGGKGGRRKDL